MELRENAKDKSKVVWEMYAPPFLQRAYITYVGWGLNLPVPTVCERAPIFTEVHDVKGSLYIKLQQNIT